MNVPLNGGADLFKQNGCMHDLPGPQLRDKTLHGGTGDVVMDRAAPCVRSSRVKIDSAFLAKSGTTVCLKLAFHIMPAAAANEWLPLRRFEGGLLAARRTRILVLVHARFAEDLVTAFGVERVAGDAAAECADFMGVEHYVFQ